MFRYYYESASPPAATGYVANVLALSPSAFWPMQDTSGNLTDETGNGWTATAQGTATYSVGGPTIGSETFDAITFDGSTDYFTVSPTLTDPSTAGFTLSAWVKHPAEAAYRQVFSWLSGTEGTMYLRKANGFGMAGATFDTAQAAVLLATITPDLDDTWTHIGLRLTTATPELKVYQGTTTGTDTTETGTWKRDGDPNCSIGALGAGTDPFNGEMALLAYWNTPLTDAQMTSLRTGTF